MGFRTCSIRWGFEHKMCFQLLLWKALLNTLKALGLNSCFDRFFFFYFWGRFWHTPISFAWNILWSLHSFLISHIVILILVTGNDSRGITSLQCEMFLLSSFPPGCSHWVWQSVLPGMQEWHGATALLKWTNVHLVNMRFLKLSLHRAKRLWPEDLSNDGYHFLFLLLLLGLLLLLSSSSLLLCVFLVSGKGCCVLTGEEGVI